MNKTARPNDTLIGAAGGTPGEITKGWRVKDPNTFDCEFGFSCMGYEIAAGWGHAMAKGGEGTPIVMLGDGTYMMMNSDIYSTVLTGHKMIVVVCDNGGYAVISRLQQFKGVPGFNNLLKDCRIQNPGNPLHVDFVKHAEFDGRFGAPLRKPCRSGRGDDLGARHRPHDGDQHHLGRLCLGAGRCRLGCGRAGNIQPATA